MTRDKIILLVGLAAVVGVANGQNLCYTPNLLLGQCIPMRECTGLMNFITARQNTGLIEAERQFVIASQCNSNIGQDIHVCCNNNDPYLQTLPTTPQPIDDDIQSNSVDGSVLPDPSKRQCGRDTFNSRVLGGNDTELGEFPWMVLLQYQDANGNRNFDCGGSLINSRYVLTVAHCLVGRVIVVHGELVNVRLGEHNIDTEPDCEMDKNKTICSDPVRDISVEQKIPHPQYVPNDSNQYHDIGLIRLGEVVTYSFFISPICLPSAHLRSETGQKLIIAGWGITLQGTKSSIKQKLMIPITDQQQCRNKFSTIRRKTIQIEDRQLCAGGETNRDSCLGDSGGPLMLVSNGSIYAEGLVSFGLSCGLTGWPAVYTRVTQYLEWIQSNLEP